MKKSYTVKASKEAKKNKISSVKASTNKHQFKQIPNEDIIFDVIMDALNLEKIYQGSSVIYVGINSRDVVVYDTDLGCFYIYKNAVDYTDELFFTNEYYTTTFEEEHPEIEEIELETFNEFFDYIYK